MKNQDQNIITAPITDDVEHGRARAAYQRAIDYKSIAFENLRGFVIGITQEYPHYVFRGEDYMGTLNGFLDRLSRKAQHDCSTAMGLIPGAHTDAIEALHKIYETVHSQPKQSSGNFADFQKDVYQSACFQSKQSSDDFANFRAIAEELDSTLKGKIIGARTTSGDAPGFDAP